LSPDPSAVRATTYGLRTLQPILAEIQRCFLSANYCAGANQVEVAFSVLEGVERSCPDKLDDVDAIQANLIPNFDSGTSSPTWLLLEWRWKQIVDIAAVVLLENIPFSVAIVLGTGRGKAAGKRKWEKAVLKWTVLDLADLGTLLGLVHKALPVANSNGKGIERLKPRYQLRKDSTNNY
jgi:hypothetical protein